VHNEYNAQKRTILAAKSHRKCLKLKTVALNKDSLFVNLDFVIPGYRDFKVGKFVYHQENELFRGKGIRRISAMPELKNMKTIYDEWGLFCRNMKLRKNTVLK